MFMRFGLVLFFISYFSVFQLFAQSMGTNDLLASEDSLKKMVGRIVEEENFERKLDLNILFKDYFTQVLSRSESFGYPFDSLKNIGKLKSNDEKVRIFTWNIPQLRGEHKYFGFIQYMAKDSVLLFELTDGRDSMVDAQNEINDPDKWHGALYYHVKQVENNGKVYYTLLGADFNNLFSVKKLIDVLWFSETGEPKFGAPIFNIRNHIISRVIFEYSARATMVLNYSNEVGMIVFDHLSPTRPDLAGNYQFYGPDFTHDGFRFEDGYWFYYANVDVRNSQPETIATPVTPPEENPEPGFLYRSNLEVREKLGKKEVE